MEIPKSARTLLPALATLIMLGCAQPAAAWDEPGHEIVATIALSQLNPKAKAALAESAREISSPGHPYDSISIACWMDDIRQDKVMPFHGLFPSWHYIDLGIEPGDPPQSLVPGDDNEMRGNVVQALKRAVVVLDGGTDPYIPNRAVACAIVMHLVGDIHQPLHCATHYFYSHGEWRDDAGGNKELVLNQPPGDPHFNLHAFWDSAWRASFDPATGNVVIDPQYNEKAGHDPASVGKLAGQIAPGGTGTSTVNIDLWAHESNTFARDFVYPGITMTGNKKYCRLSSGYVAKAQILARDRLRTAGNRLAALLNETIGADHPGPPPASYPAGPPAPPPY